MRKPLTTFFAILVLTSIFWNCKQEKVISETEFEQAVFYEIFPSILDSIYDDRRKSPPPPPPSPEFFDKYGSIDEAIEAYKKTDVYIQAIKDYKRKKDS